MERAASGVDVAAIRLRANANYIAAERSEEFGAEFVGGAVRAVKNNAKSLQRSTGNYAVAEKRQVLVMKRIIGPESRQREGNALCTMLEDVRLNSFLDGIRDFHPLVGKGWHAIILIRIVRGGDDDAYVKIILAYEVGHAGSGEDSGEGGGGTTVEKAGCDYAGDMRTGFTGIGADQRMGRSVAAVKKFCDGAAKRKKSGVIEGRCTGDATNAVRAKKLSRHRVKGR